MTTPARRAVAAFLDRDGTLIEHVAEARVPRRALPLHGWEAGSDE
jgi:hypothetical protein